MNHRLGLYDAFLIKENHIMAAGSIEGAISAARAHASDRLVEVEVENLDELALAIAAKADRIMLDNFELLLLAEAVQIVNKRFETEASGGVNIHNVRKVAKTGVDYISIGALTHSATSLDLSLKVLK